MRRATGRVKRAENVVSSRAFRGAQARSARLARIDWTRWPPLLCLSVLRAHACSGGWASFLDLCRRVLA